MTDEKRKCPYDDYGPCPLPCEECDNPQTIKEASIQQPDKTVEDLKDALRDILKAICTDKHAVQDTLWVNKTPVGDFIMCVLDEEIDCENLHLAPYKCKKTKDMLTVEVLKGVREGLKRMDSFYLDKLYKGEKSFRKILDEQLAALNQLIGEG